MKAKSPASRANPLPSIDSENQPKYRQGTIEREAYDMLLKSSPAIAGLVQGGNPSLQIRFVGCGRQGRRPLLGEAEVPTGGEIGRGIHLAGAAAVQADYSTQLQCAQLQ